MAADDADRSAGLRRSSAPSSGCAIVVVIALGAAGHRDRAWTTPGTPHATELTAAGDAGSTRARRRAGRPRPPWPTRSSARQPGPRRARRPQRADPTAGETAIADGRPLVVADRRPDRGLCATTWRRCPYVGTPTAGLIVSDAVVARHAALVAALDADRRPRRRLGAADDRRRRGDPAEQPSSPTTTLVGGGRRRPASAKYAEAIKLLDQADALIAAARDDARQPGQHRRRLDPRRVARRATRLRRRAAQPVHGDSKVGTKVTDGDAARRSKAEPRPAPSCRRTPAAWSSSWPRSAGAG